MTDEHVSERVISTVLHYQYNKQYNKQISLDLHVSQRLFFLHNKFLFKALLRFYMGGTKGLHCHILLLFAKMNT